MESIQSLTISELSRISVLLSDAWWFFSDASAYSLGTLLLQKEQDADVK